MAFSHTLAEAGFTPKRVATKAAVKMDKVGDGFKIVRIELTTEADVPGIDEATFMEHAQAAKDWLPRLASFGQRGNHAKRHTRKLATPRQGILQQKTSGS